MVGSDIWTTKRVLIVVRTYPTPARRGVEVSCTAGITEEGKWIRLFPIPYRFLHSGSKFRKYQTIEARVKRSADPRPESYEIDVDSISILSEPLTTANNWQTRKDRVFPLMSSSLCELQQQRQSDGDQTLGFFKPQEITFQIKREKNSEWTPDQLERLNQYSFFENAPSNRLEKIPYKFSYRFRCGASWCRGHDMICTDWELMESYRKWRREYGREWRAKFKSKYADEMIGFNDLHFYVGTIHRHPNSWIIIGLFYPRKSPDRLPGF